MAMMVPHDGQVQLLTDLLGGGSLEAWTLKLFQSNTTPADTDTTGTYTEATFTGYSSKTLTRSVSGSTWNTPTETGSTINSTDAISTYGSSAQSWSATSVQTVYGYYIVGATSTKLMFAERFASAVGLVNPSTLSLTPALELGHQ